MIGRVRAVFFDAVGTLIYADPPVTAVYGDVIARICGRSVTPERIRSVLISRLSGRLATGNLQTDESQEERFWFDLISEIVPTPEHTQQCFEELYRHFAQPENWRCFDDVAATFQTLRHRGLTIGIASNFDKRLHRICMGLPELVGVAERIISSEVGWRKPAAHFFEIVRQKSGCRPGEILFVGDDPDNDVAGAREAGMIAVWLDRSCGSRREGAQGGQTEDFQSAGRICSLGELPEQCDDV